MREAEISQRELKAATQGSRRSLQVGFSRAVPRTVESCGTMRPTARSGTALVLSASCSGRGAQVGWDLAGLSEQRAEQPRADPEGAAQVEQICGRLEVVDDRPWSFERPSEDDTCNSTESGPTPVAGLSIQGPLSCSADAVSCEARQGPAPHPEPADVSEPLNGLSSGRKVAKSAAFRPETSSWPASGPA